MTGARLLIVGLDGATWDLADRFISDGRMPHLARLVREGARAPLNSTTPPMTLPSWSSMLTGCNPGAHGIFDFVRRVPDTWRLEFTNATHRRVPTLHRVLSDRGGRVASIAVPTTWPPEPLNGVVVSGFDSPVSTGIDGSFCHPPGLFDELKQRFGGLRFADFQESRIGPGWHDDALGALLREIPRKRNIGEWLLGQERWDCFMLMFGESDTVSHHFWMFQDPDSPRHPAQCAPRLADAIATVYAELDVAVGRLIEAAQPDVVCLCSDHGFGGAGVHVLYLNRFLEQTGWLKYRRQVEVTGLSASGGLLDRVRGLAVERVPADWQGRLFRAAPDGLIGRMETSSRFGNIDFDHTRAVSDEMNYAATVRLNLDEGDDPTAAVAELSDLLGSWEVDGHRPVQGVYTREQLYTGACVPDSPELILDLALRDGYSYTLLPSARSAPGQTWRVLDDDEHVGGKGLGMNGTHRQYGLLSLWGRGVAADVEVAAGMPDIAPTLLHLLGEPVPSHMDGHVLHEALLGEEPEQVTDDAPQVAAERATDAASAEAIRRRLETLGYL